MIFVDCLCDWSAPVAHLKTDKPEKVARQINTSLAISHLSAIPTDRLSEMLSPINASVQQVVGCIEDNDPCGIDNLASDYLVERKSVDVTCVEKLRTDLVLIKDNADFFH